MSQKKEAYKAGKTHGISGRELFEFNPEYVKGDDEEAGDDDVMVLRREVRPYLPSVLDGMKEEDGGMGNVALYPTSYLVYVHLVEVVSMENIRLGNDHQYRSAYVG